MIIGHTKSWLATPENAQGQINLLGELTAYSSVRRPVFLIRDEAVNPYSLSGNYKGLAQLKYAP